MLRILLKCLSLRILLIFFYFMYLMLILLGLFINISIIVIVFTSLNPKGPPPHPQTLFSSSIAKLLENPQLISINLGSKVQSLAYLRCVGVRTIFLYNSLFSVLCIPYFKSLIPTCPFIFKPHENNYPFYVKHKVWLKPPATLAIFLGYPSTLIYIFTGFAYFALRPVPVAPDTA